MKIVILDGYTANPGDLSWESFKRLGSLTVYDRTSLDDTAEIISRIGNAEAIVTNKTPITKQVIDACPNIKYIGVLATGYNIVDIEAASHRGIPVCNVPAYGTFAVAQYAIALLLEICCCAGHHSDAVKQGRWEACPDFCFWDYPLTELAGKTMGIIGFGRIGRAVGMIAKVMGMSIIAHDMHEDDEGRSIADYIGLDELFVRSDVISLHCPPLPETEELINKDTIAKMKNGVIIINNSRGQLINEHDLSDALDSGKVGAAAVDVVSAEPIRADNPLLTAQNCTITPHISWASTESRGLINIAAENLKAYINGSPVNTVNNK